MSPIDVICGQWPALTARLEATNTLARWADRESAFAGLSGIGALPVLIQTGADWQLADDLLGALVRLAAADGGDDEDAVLVLLYLMAPGARSLARQMRDVAPDIDSLVCGELTIQIRAFPWRRRTRAYAANLLLDTRVGLWRELRPHRRRRHPVVEIPVDPTAPEEIRGGGLLDLAAAEHDGDELDVLDVLCWAERTGLVTADEVALLVDLTCAGQVGLAAVADRHGMSARSARRHRARLLDRLRAASQRYLTAAA